MSISVIIPTFRRPEGLERALRSVFGQSRLPDEIVVVDNAPEAPARDLIAALQADAPCPVIYVHEPRSGVSSARNAGFAAAKGRFIAFLDDDETADAGWLEAFSATAKEQDASVVFGPLRGKAVDSNGIRGDLTLRLYSRVGPTEDCRIEEPYGCGNSFIDRSAFDLPNDPFDERMNLSGGEDDVFFLMLSQQGARFAWSVKASGIEWVDPKRSNWRYLSARAFAFGQGATQTARYAGKPAKVLFWMGVGLGQVMIYAPMAALAALFMPRKAAGLINRTIQGAGKLFWIDAFQPRFYGQSLTAPS
ncbi:glycosyltransferase family 2 protein [Maricaulis parjimensis]|uniref:glycosyltransferase family 2 protein n=1 Tax=Maricaulis parjimensis TaxID=144023 RepID=UPI00193954BC|nr:glycosyltransferase family 2 protein [Maricaulis parjimensis]